MKVVMLTLLIFVNYYYSFSQSDTSIHYLLKGKGNAPVIFVSGLGEDHSTWKKVQDSVSMFTITLSYDRAGLGRSRYKEEKKDLATFANELQETILRAGVDKPFILVGHSLGCQIIKQYAVLHQNFVKGIIFIDPGFSEEKLEALLPDSVWKSRETMLKKYVPKFSTAQQQEFNELNSNIKQADNIQISPSIPVILLTATKTNASFPGSKEELTLKMDSHKFWLKSMPSAKHLITANSRHYIHVDEPELIIGAIRSFLPDSKLSQ